jgi:flagellar basal body rod protein FlgG
VIYGMHLSTAGMMVNQYRQDVVANNIANVDTIGFKHDLALLTERPVESREDAAAARHAHPFFDRLTGGTMAASTRHVLSEGPTILSGGKLDLRIEGRGFFQVSTAAGPRFTRDGRFVLRPDGTLETAAGGHPVIAADGRTLRVPPGGPAEFDDTGALRQDGEVRQRIAVVDFPDPASLRKVGGNLFAPVGAAKPSDIQARLRPAALEGSTVDPVSGLTEMIQISRAFEINANFLRLQDQTLGRLISEAARF